MQRTVRFASNLIFSANHTLDASIHRAFAPRSLGSVAHFCTEKAAASEQPAEPQQEPAAAQADAATGEEQSTENSAEPSPETLLAELETLKTTNKELTELRLRSLAEMENVRHIAKRDVENAKLYSIQKFAKGLLDVADNLDRAIQSVKPEDLVSSPALQSLHEGLLMTEKEMFKLFSKYEIEKYGEEGDEFDPHKYDALFNMPRPDLKAGQVAQVLKTGYTFRDRVLRPAEVGTVSEE